MTWQEQARCAGAPAFGDRTAPEDIDNDLALCRGCPVKRECADQARSAGSRHNGTGFDGIAGGYWWVNGAPKDPPHHRRPHLRLAEDELTAGHAAWQRGERTPHNQRLEQAYQRVKYQARKKRRKQDAA
jgi:Ni/Co efflux regulator RcnB